MTRRILLIDDEQLSQDIIAGLLRGQGHDVDVAVDGFSALEKARARRYDVALVDYHLPEMDGYTLGRLLREQHAGAEGSPILIGLTADSNGLAARRGSDAVFRAILPKPIQPAELFSTIERLCQVFGRAAIADVEPPKPDDCRRSAAALWHEHGLPAPPKAFASPCPTAEQAAALNLCFQLVRPEEAQCVVLLERHGINEAVRVTKQGQSAPMPIVGLSVDLADICDLLFQVEDAASWKALSAALRSESTPVVQFSAAMTIPKLELAGPSRPIDDSAAATPVRESWLDPHSSSQLHGLLLAGVQAPLAALRRGLIADEGAVAEGLRRTRLVAQVDEVLLAAGAISDALSPSQPSASTIVELDPWAFLLDALAMISDSRPSGTVRLSLRANGALPRRVRTDAHRLSQIVLTLLDDACTGPAPVALIVHASFEATRGSLVLRLEYEPGQNLPEAGTAVVAMLRRLRLTTLCRLVQLMGGHLDQHDGLVALSMPAELAAATLLRPDAQGDDPANVLLVDDDATIGQTLTLLLIRAGHRVTRVGDGEAAAFACRHARHDLAVFGLRQNEQTRMVALAGLHAFQRAEPDVPVIVLADREARRDDLGDVPVLVKPVSPDALAQAVAACRRHPAPAGARPVGPIDEEMRDGLVCALGAPAVTRLTSQLLAQIEALLAAPELGSDGCARLVELAGCASVLGLPALAKLCARPEIAVLRIAATSLGKALQAPIRSVA